MCVRREFFKGTASEHDEFNSEVKEKSLHITDFQELSTVPIVKDHRGTAQARVGISYLLLSPLCVRTPQVKDETLDLCDLGMRPCVAFVLI